MGHSERTHVRFKLFLYEDLTINAIPTFWVIPNSYPAHFPTLISIAPTLVPYLLSLTHITTLITSYPTDLAIVLTTYPTNLATLLITYPTNLTIRFRVETHKLINKFFTNV